LENLVPQAIASSKIAQAIYAQNQGHTSLCKNRKIEGGLRRLD